MNFVELDQPALFSKNPFLVMEDLLAKDIVKLILGI